MSAGIISNKLKSLNFKKIDLIEYLPISRSTLYVYMEYYENDLKEQIPDVELIRLFDYILSDEVTKNDIIKYMLDHFKNDDNKKNTFSDRDYGTEENVKILQDNLIVLRKAAGWSYDFLSKDTGIQVERLKKIEYGQTKITKLEAIALFTSLCRESRNRDEDDILPITLSVLFDEHNLLPEEKDAGLAYILAVTKSIQKIKPQEFKGTFQQMTGKKIGAGVVIGAAAVVVGGLVISFIKNIK